MKPRQVIRAQSFKALIMSSTRIALAIAQGIPADALAVRSRDIDEDDESGTPPCSVIIIAVAARRPAPTVVVIDPATIMVRRPAPRLVADPSPSVRRTPDPVAVAIGRPVVIVVDDRHVRTPYPAVICTRINPIAVGI